MPSGNGRASTPGGGPKGPPEQNQSAPKKFLLRLNPELYGALEQWAADELRSVNAQIEFLLREAARQAGRLPNGGAGRAGGLLSNESRQQTCKVHGAVEAQGATR